MLPLQHNPLVITARSHSHSGSHSLKLCVILRMYDDDNNTNLSVWMAISQYDRRQKYKMGGGGVHNN
jgi:hypothetical protein